MWFVSSLIIFIMSLMIVNGIFYCFNSLASMCNLLHFTSYTTAVEYISLPFLSQCIDQLKTKTKSAGLSKAFAFVFIKKHGMKPSDYSQCTAWRYGRVCSSCNTLLSNLCGIVSDYTCSLYLLNVNGSVPCTKCVVFFYINNLPATV